VEGAGLEEGARRWECGTLPESIEMNRDRKGGEIIREEMDQYSCLARNILIIFTRCKILNYI
jgi:hypothetical protein